MFGFSCVVENLSKVATLEGNECINSTSPPPSPSLTETIGKSRFKLPIQYLPSEQIHPLSAIVANDLELIPSPKAENGGFAPGQKSMYEILFRPTHSFAENIIPQWVRSHTTNIEYLTDTQKVIRETKCFTESETTTKETCEKMTEIWNAVKNDDGFLEHYSYLEWDMLKSLNTNSSFLQSVTIANMISPVMCFLLPIFFLIFPFLILKLKGIPIDIATYIEVLTEIARKHFIGQILMNCKELDMQNMVYVIAMCGLYFYQIYQNYVVCIHFYERIQKINNYLNTTKEFVNGTIRNMEKFAKITQAMGSYKEFNKDLANNLATLCEIRENLSGIHPFEVSIYKVAEIGGLLKQFYFLYSVEEYGNALQYSFDFEGYIDNLRGVYANLESGTISAASYTTLDEDQVMDNQFYPPLSKAAVGSDGNSGGEITKNTCTFEKNIIITGPNASGKTTLLKTTLINLIFSQQVGCGFYSACKLRPYDHIHSYLNIPDTSGRDSLFQAESRRCKEIIDAIVTQPSDRHFAIFDELYSGTNPEEASKSAYAFLLFLNGKANVSYMLTTHYIKVCKRLRKNPRVRCLKMDVEETVEGGLKYLYRIKRGISKIQGAVRVLKDMDYPLEIIENIEKYNYRV